MCEEQAYLICLREEGLAVLKHTAGYVLPGGAVAPGETHEACLLRNVLHQLGFDIRVDELVMQVEGRYFYSGELLDPLFPESDSALCHIPRGRIGVLLTDSAERAAVQAYTERQTSAAALAFIDGKHEYYG